MQTINPYRKDFISKEELRLGVIEFYHDNYYEVISEIDDRFGEGFSKGHPEIVASILNSYHSMLRLKCKD